MVGMGEMKLKDVGVVWDDEATVCEIHEMPDTDVDGDSDSEELDVAFVVAAADKEDGDTEDALLVRAETDDAEEMSKKLDVASTPELSTLTNSSWNLIQTIRNPLPSKKEVIYRLSHPVPIRAGIGGTVSEPELVATLFESCISRIRRKRTASVMPSSSLPTPHSRPRPFTRFPPPVDKCSPDAMT